jgi:hypothetical protein
MACHAWFNFTNSARASVGTVQLQLQAVKMAEV